MGSFAADSASLQAFMTGKVQPKTYVVKWTTSENQRQRELQDFLSQGCQLTKTGPPSELLKAQIYNREMTVIKKFDGRLRYSPTRRTSLCLCSYQERVPTSC